MPAEDAQLEQVGGDTDRYDAELRPELMRRTIVELQDAGIEADIWKIEGIDTQEDCERIADTARRDGRDGVVCVVLGRGADDAKVDHWLRQGAPVDGYAGFAIGRSIWWDALKGFLDGEHRARGRRRSRSRTTTCASCEVYEPGRAGSRHGRKRPACNAGSLRRRCGCVNRSRSSRRPSARRPPSPSQRRERLRKEAAHRSRARRVERQRKAGSLRFALLALTLVATAVIVTVVMFETLAMLAG